MDSKRLQVIVDTTFGAKRYIAYHNVNNITHTISYIQEQPEDQIIANHIEKLIYANRFSFGANVSYHFKIKMEPYAPDRIKFKPNLGSLPIGASFFFMGKLMINLGTFKDDNTVLFDLQNRWANVGLVPSCVTQFEKATFTIRARQHPLRSGRPNCVIGYFAEFENAKVPCLIVEDIGEDCYLIYDPSLQVVNRHVGKIINYFEMETINAN